MITNVTLSPFFGVLLYSTVLKACYLLHSRRRNKLNKTTHQAYFAGNTMDNCQKEDFQCEMDKPMESAEHSRDTKITRRAPFKTSSGPEALKEEADDGSSNGTIQSSNYMEETTNDPSTNSSITSLCDEKGYKTIIAVNQNAKNLTITPSKTYLETEIDSYSAVEYSKGEPPNSRPPTPPKPSMKAFTFGIVSPFTGLNEPDHVYSEIDKTKKRPTVPPKPKGIKSRATHLENMLHNSSTSLAKPISYQSTFQESNVMVRGNSLPNLDSKQDESKLSNKNAFRFSLAAPPPPILSTGYGQIQKSKDEKTPVQREDGANDTTEYCDILPESPPYVNNLYANVSKNSDEEESIYEDVTIPNENQTAVKRKVLKIEVEPPVLDTEHSDYVPMMSPVSEINFSFGRYENTANISVPALKNPGIFEVPKIYQNTSEFEEKGVILEPPRQFSSSKSPSLSEGRNSTRPKPLEFNTSVTSCYENLPVDPTVVSPSSSVASTSQYSGNSIASTATSSFQGIQVCYFPPTPPPEFYEEPPYSDGNLVEEHSATKNRKDKMPNINSPKSSIKRKSRSKLPKTVKPKQSFESIPIPEEVAPPLPVALDPDPNLEGPKVESEQSNKITPKMPPSGKAMRWYEKLGCIQTGALQPSEPYGLPGERKQSKSKERRRSQFFVDSQELHPSENEDALV